MKIIGYHRTSTTEQHLDRGINEIKKYCEENNIRLYKDKVYCDQHTGKSFDRPTYRMLKELLEEGDTLIITEVDRLGRNKKDTLKELRYYKENDIRVMILEIPTTLIDYSKLDNSMTSMLMETINNMLIEMYASLAQAEIHKKEKRQREGMKAMRERGEWGKYGRPKSMELEEFKKHYQRVQDGEIAPFKLIKELGLTKPTFYRYKNQIEREIASEIEKEEGKGEIL